MKIKRFFSGMMTLSILLTGCASTGERNASRLQLIKKRNSLICGVSGKIPGFSFLETDGTYQGLDIDICKAFAAAFIGDSKRVQYRPLTAAERFTAVRTGEIDLLSRNTTFNLSRDSIGGNGLTFAPVIFHDGQGLMVKRNSRINTIESLANKSICVGSGTTTEQNINDAFEAISLPYTPIKYQDLNQVVAGYLQGRCSAMTSDRSQLAAARSGFPKPEDHIILNDILSKEPLAPASSGGDQKLSDAMRWVIFSLISAEEQGITKGNIKEKLQIAQNNPQMKSLRRFLGVEGDLGEKIGLANDFVVKVISSTGNYGEIYNRHLGINSEVPIPRGLNKLYNKGGVQIAPPFN
ncbi:MULTISPECIES: amino acid ABC transporter substrate-binding protein [Prochlorococcus]|uniref:ABC-type amino acid transport/signal transduction systems, periplasmic component/domain n=1 Tax=Prochlorococcus marinus (strain SARG / CCMP1375 / SS120) TaxID=167539 RepID=Q7VCR4_PROMA|nr:MULTISPECIES: amino acid ABC transporter substrate-binding protein [Prochlorococcus]AAP99720.1 ABC-type amino acid transport/signal transduction systems, periplasmic component/domain [Prochlorococcus marinus subsp. marinus str. CCMP1375]KGG21377.1 ABC transporter [Prochlorococcus marinus str. SS2]KGG24291.1 ABC transporter [Prochlorococcus marinus str. SS35]KGG36509.1 ABC transporter [Prochlorococcus sp. SS52]